MMGECLQLSGFRCHTLPLLMLCTSNRFTYSEAWYLCICSTVASLIVTGSLIGDYLTTKNFRNAGSGLTQKQKELVIMGMVFLVYLSLGSLVFAFVLHISFIDALYFSLCTITTVSLAQFSGFFPTQKADLLSSRSVSETSRRTQWVREFSYSSSRPSALYWLRW